MNARKRLWLSFFAILLVNIAATMSSVVTNVSLSNIRGELQLGVTQTQWIGLCFLIGLALMVPLADYFGKKYGYKKIFCWGSTIFLVGDLLSSISPNYPLFLFMRGVSGLGAGFIFPLSLTLISKEFYHKNSTFAVAAYLALMFGLGMSMGALLSGYFAEIYTWRLIFHVIFAIGALGLILAYFYVKEFLENYQSSLDFKSLIGFCGIAFSILIILINARAPWNTEDWRSYFMLSMYICLLASTIFMVYSLKTAKHPLFNLSLFKIRSFTLCSIAVFLIGGIVFGSLSTFASLLYNDFGWPKSQIGKILMPFGLTLAFTGFLSALLTKKIGLRLPSLLGMVFIVVGCFINHYLTIQSDHSEILAPLLIRAFGIGLCLGPLTALGLQKVPPSSIGMAAMMITIARQMGSTYISAFIHLIITVRTVLHTQRFGEQFGQQQQGLRHYRRFLNFDFMRNAPDTHQRALEQANLWIIDFTQAQAEILAANDAFFIYGILLSIATCFIAFFSIVYWISEKKTQSSST